MRFPDLKSWRGSSLTLLDALIILLTILYIILLIIQQYLNIHLTHLTVTLHRHWIPSAGIIRSLADKHNIVVPLQLPVKLPRQALAVTSVPGHNISRIFYIKDHLSNFCLLVVVDTGAAVSMIPPSSAECSHPSDTLLTAVNNTTITTYSSHFLTLDLSLIRTFRWAFVYADVGRPILGADSSTISIYW